jgi:uncharacterized protein (DUF1499 family)
MFRRIRHLALALVALVALAFGWFALTTREESVLAHLWEMMIGPPDLGAVDFETFARSTKPNNALACPPDLCRNAKADITLPVYQMSDDDLRAAFMKVAMAEQDVALVYRSTQAGRPVQDRYIQRTRLMRFPDTIDVRFIALGNDTSTMAIYSRSQIGHSDMGVNIARIRRWTDPARLTAAK